jgi:hypothetical protein
MYMLNTLPSRNYTAYMIIMKNTAQLIKAIDNVRYHGAIKEIVFAFRLIKIKLQKINQNIKYLWLFSR